MYITTATIFILGIAFILLGVIIGICVDMNIKKDEARIIYIVEERIHGCEYDDVNAIGYYASHDAAFEAMKKRMTEVASDEEIEELHLTKGDGEWDEYILPETEDYCQCTYTLYSVELNWKME